MRCPLAWSRTPGARETVEKAFRLTKEPRMEASVASPDEGHGAIAMAFRRGRGVPPLQNTAVERRKANWPSQGRRGVDLRSGEHRPWTDEHRHAVASVMAPYEADDALGRSGGRHAARRVRRRQSGVGRHDGNRRRRCCTHHAGGRCPIHIRSCAGGSHRQPLADRDRDVVRDRRRRPGGGCRRSLQTIRPMRSASRTICRVSSPTSTRSRRCSPTWS